MTELVKFNLAYQALMVARNIDEVKEIRDKMEALRLYLKQQGESLEMQNVCAEIKLRAERKAGKLLKEMPKASGGQPYQNEKPTGNTMLPVENNTPTLADIGITKMQSSRFQAVADIPEDIFETQIAETKANQEELTTKQLLATAKQGIHFSSETNEWYTPKSIIELVQKVLNEIDLDPCSNSQKNIPATSHYTEQDNGLAFPWHGRVYMNPPYGREIAEWTKYLDAQYKCRNTLEAIALIPARTDTEWFRELKEYPRCFIWGRLKFSDFDNSAPFPSMAVYLGQNPKQFIQVFSSIGDIYQRIYDTSI